MPEPHEPHLIKAGECPFGRAGLDRDLAMPFALDGCALARLGIDDAQMRASAVRY